MRRLALLAATVAALVAAAPASAVPFLGDGCVNANHDQEQLVDTVAGGRVRLFNAGANVADVRAHELASLRRAFAGGSPFLGVLGVRPRNLQLGRPLDVLGTPHPTDGGDPVSGTTFVLCGESDRGLAGLMTDTAEQTAYRDETLLHELFHVLHAAHDPDNADTWWWAESTAEWAGTTFAASHSPSTRARGVRLFLRQPSTSLDHYRSDDEDHAYATYLFVEWLQHKLGEDFPAFARASLRRPLSTRTVAAAVARATGASMGSNLAEFWAQAVSLPATAVATERVAIPEDGTSLERSIAHLAASVVDIAPRPQGFRLEIPPRGRSERFDVWVAYGPSRTTREIGPEGEELTFCPAGSRLADSEPLPPYLRLVQVNGNVEAGERTLTGIRAEPEDCDRDDSATAPDRCPPVLDQWVKDQMAAGAQFDQDGRIVANSYVEPEDGWLCEPLRAGADVCRRATRLPRSLTLDAPSRGGSLGGLRFGMTRGQVCSRWGAPRVAYGDRWWWGADSPTTAELEQYQRAAGKRAFIISYCRYAFSYLPAEQRPRDRPCRHDDMIAAYQRGGRLAPMLGPQAPPTAAWVAAGFGPHGLREVRSWRAGDRGPDGARPGMPLDDLRDRLDGASCTVEGCETTRRGRGGRCAFAANRRPIHDFYLYPDLAVDRGAIVRTLWLNADGRGCTAR